MEKAFKLDFQNDKVGSLYVNCCGCSQTEPLHSFGPASKPHYLIHFVLSGKGIFRFHDKEYTLEAGYGFLIQPNELAFYQADERKIYKRRQNAVLPRLREWQFQDGPLLRVYGKEHLLVLLLGRIGILSGGLQFTA